MNYIDQKLGKSAFILLLMLCCSQLKAAPILFDFESGDGLNPILTKDGLTLTHTSVMPSTSQLVTDSRSLPFEGNGSMRLSITTFGDSSVTAKVMFSWLLSDVSLWALNVNPSFATFTVSALSATDSVLSTISVDLDNVYTLLDFTGLGPIAALEFSSSAVNIAYWDNLSATVIPINRVPAPQLFSLLLISIFFILKKSHLHK